MIFIKDFFRKYHLVLMLVFFAVMYLPGIFMGFGRTTLSGDELHVINSVLKFFRDWHFNDPYAYAFPVMTVLYVPFLIGWFVILFWLGLVSDITSLSELVLFNLDYFVPVFRLVTVFFSLIVLILTYVLAKVFFKDYQWACMAMYLSGCSFVFAKNSFVAIKWMPQLMIILFALLWLLLRSNKNRILLWRDYVTAGLLVSLSYGVALVGLVVIFPYMFVWFQIYKNKLAGSWKGGLFIFLITLLSCSAILTLSVPTLAKSSFNFAADVASTGYGENIRTTLPGYRYWGYAEQLLYTDPILVILAMVGFVISFKTNRRLWVITSATILIYYVMLGPVMGAVRQRRLLIIIPFLSFLAVAGLKYLHERGLFRRLWVRGLIVFIAVIFIANPMIVLSEVYKQDSKLLAREWIQKKYSTSKVILYDECLLELPENNSYVTLLKERFPSLVTSKHKYLEKVDLPTVDFITITDPLVREIAYLLPEYQDRYFVFCFSSIPDTPEYTRELHQRLSYFGLQETKINYKPVYDSTSSLENPTKHFHYLINQVTPKYILDRLHEDYTGDHIRIFKTN